MNAIYWTLTGVIIGFCICLLFPAVVGYVHHLSDDPMEPPALAGEVAARRGGTRYTNVWNADALAPMEEGGEARDSERLAREDNKAMASLAGTEQYPKVSRRLPALGAPVRDEATQGNTPETIARLAAAYRGQPLLFMPPPPPEIEETFQRLKGPVLPGED